MDIVNNLTFPNALRRMEEQLNNENEEETNWHRRGKSGNEPGMNLSGKRTAFLKTLKSESPPMGHAEMLNSQVNDRAR